MKIIKSVLCLLLCGCLLFTVGCDKETIEDTPSAEASSQDEDFSQTDLPQKGEEVAVLHTSMGDITLRLFPQYAPKAVENFKGLINEGYYDGIIFHRVMNDFMIQGGDPTGTGRGGDSYWGKDFEDEFAPQVHNIRGALSMANSGQNTNGSQFFIVQASSVDEGFLEQMEAYPDSYPADCIENYEELGGTPWLDYVHTVFGQVIDGMETVDKIAGVEVDEDDKPLKDVVIKSAEIIEYK